MPRKSSVPFLRQHRPTRQGVVTLSGKDHYLAVWPDDQPTPPVPVREAYDRLTGIWLANGRMLPPNVTSKGEILPAPPPSVPSVSTSPDQPPSIDTDPEAIPDVSVNDVILRFVVWAEGYYRDTTGAPTHELDNIKDALKPLRRLFGNTDEQTFGPLQ